MGLGNLFNRLFKPILEALPENNRLERIWLMSKIEFRKRYYDNYLGIIWALINPLFRLFILWFVWVKMLGKDDIENFHLFLFVALVPWMFFMEGTKKGMKILHSKRYLIESIQLNKIDFFYASILSVSFGFLFNMIAYFIIHGISGADITVHLAWSPLIFLNIIVLVLGVSLIISTLTITLKDTEHLWDMVLMAGFWVTPILMGRAVMQKFPILLYANPMAAPVVNFRSSIYYGEQPDLFLMAYSWTLTIIILLIGIFVHKKYSHFLIEKQ